MSMQFIYRRVSPAEYRRLLKDKEYLGSFMEGDLYEESFDWTVTAGETVTTKTKCIDIMDDQLALHYLLTGEAATETTVVLGPLGSVVFGGTETEWEAGIEMLSYLAPEDVRASAAALAAITEEELAERFDSDEMQNPDNFPDPRNWQNFALDRMLTVFTLVRDFFQVAATVGDGLLCGIY